MFRPAFLLLPLVLLLSGCEGFFGVKTPTDFLGEPVYDNRTVAYVPIQPVWAFSRPVDVIAGWDELIYVADAGTEEIVALDQAGRELGRFPVPGLTAIAQDRRLDLLAAGHTDTVINGIPRRLAALYRIDLNKTGAYGLANARVTRKLVHPFYFKSATPSGADEQVRFTGIAPLADNRYYLTRTGPSNSPSQFGGPDDAVLRFNADDQFSSPVVASTSLGEFTDYFRAPSAIAGLAQPPQSPAVNRRGDFAFASRSEALQLRVQVIRFEESEFGASYVVSNLFSADTSRADGFLYTPNRFTDPADLAYSGDGTNYLFVVDAARDSLYQFNAEGLEGVRPPAGSRSPRAVRVSFGGTGQGLTQFREPRGVAYLDRIVYVADAGNGRVLRFKLTTDFN